MASGWQRGTTVFEETRPEVGCKTGNFFEETLGGATVQPLFLSSF